MTQYAGNDVFPASADTVNDGTGRDAASVNVAAEAVLDRTRWLYNRRVEAVYRTSWDPVEGGGGDAVSHANSSVYVDWPDFSGSDPAYIDVPSLEIDDVVIVTASFGIWFNNATGHANDLARIRIAVVEPSQTIALPGASLATSTFEKIPAALTGVHVIVEAGLHRFKMQGRAVVGALSAASSSNIAHNFSMQIVHLKR